MLLSLVISGHAHAGQAALAWDPSPAPAVTGYYLYYGIASGAYSIKIDVGNQTTFTVLNLKVGQTFFLAVTAYDSSRAESAFSNEAQVSISQTFLTSSLNPSTFGANVTFTASVTGLAPTGTVNFTDGATSISGCSARSLSGTGNTRTATCTTTSFVLGPHSVVARYNGNAANTASTSTALSQMVNPLTGPPQSFTDVPTSYWAFAAIEAVKYNAITVGCATNPLRFCPDGDVGRDEMAVFLERATRGIGFPFTPTGTLFWDVPMSHWAVGPIEQLFHDDITVGCGISPLRFCPDALVSRAEMAIFLLKARFGPTYNPGTATGLIFADVAQSHWAAAWIERFSALGYTSGCSVSPLQFCPDDVVTRASTAVFLQRVFNLVGPP